MSKLETGRQKTGGRQKGTPNKVTKALKDMILGALDDAGGQTYLADQAKANPAAFMTLVGKVLPMQVAGDADNPLNVINTIRREVIDKSAESPDA
ncbi:hypothetical protein ACFSTI_25085 [Rhizorhabdus histidinilytica]|uniref:DUF5681 domain-containing protein n=1 Tax=Rhizorhabdus histidinilytica TaxID=439228 RepID=A0A1T5A7V6_9SPHN|nr:hypothetical protein [Rhizorhabdus histidinilytica]SKB31000.1 hypothetical protein SAMN06295920_101681 [Rhizorhabdus histidinilytica]